MSVSRNFSGEPDAGPALVGWSGDTGSQDNHYVLYVLVFIFSFGMYRYPGLITNFGTVVAMRQISV